MTGTGAAAPRTDDDEPDDDSDADATPWWYTFTAQSATHLPSPYCKLAVHL
ncbi:hypothetical protein AB0H03_09180 [Streptomyces sparsogenes]|uniref:hypothetical protein n=1 Tax=Streptomyces sparsogenes TaxID=67365 RepID=UPI003406BDE8